MERLEDRLAPTCDCYANLFAGPRLVSVDSNQSVLLEGVFNSLLPGSSIDLAVADWNAIATGNVQLNTLLGALKADLGLSTTSQVLAANVTLGQIFNATADAIPADGPTAALHAAVVGLEQDVSVPALSQPIRLGDLLRITFPDGSFADARLNVLNLVTGTIELYNYRNVATTNDPVTISGTVLNQPGINTVEMFAQVIEPPIIDPVVYKGDQFYSAAIRLKLNVDLVDITVPGLVSVTVGQMQVYADVARAQGEVVFVHLVDAVQKAVTVQASHGVTHVYVGSISDSLFFNRTRVINPATDLGFGTVGTVTTALGQILSLQAKAYAQGTAPISTALEFFGPYPESKTTGTSATFIANAVDDLLTSLTVRVTTLGGVVVPDPTANLRQTVANTIYQPLTSILAGVADPALQLLGVGIGEMDVTINGTNCPPVANNDTATTLEDTAVVINVLANDTDNDGGINPTTVTIASGPAHGSVSVNATTGAVTYTPSLNYNGPDSFTYTVRDRDGAESCPATVSITVTPVNDRPVANDDFYTTNEDTPLTIAAPGVLGNDTDVDSPTLTAILVSGPSHGTVTLNSNGSFTYIPAPNYNGPDSYTYKANDGQLDSNIATVYITVLPVNDPPTANNDTYTTNEDTPLTIAAPGVLANDTDPDSPTLTAILVNGPSHGTVTLNSNGSFTYTPAPNYNGPDSFTYRANDGQYDSNIATVSITVLPVNDPPIANNDAYTTNEDTPLTIAAPGVLGNDTDVDSPTLTAVLVSGPSHGTVTLNSNGSFTYTPAPNYNGPDSFTYKANDGQADSNIATVNITVLPVNDPPVAVNDSYGTDEDTPLIVPAPGVLANDTDPDGNPITAIFVSGPSHGTLTLNADGSFTYTPAPNFHGTDTFTYKANDGQADSNIATVTIFVTCINDPPVAVNDAYSTAEDTPLTVAAPGVLANDTDVEGDALTAMLVTGPSHGTVTLNSNGSFTYTPAPNYSGPDSFTYKANDGQADSNIATVNITVGPVNDPPIANNDAYTTNEDTPLTVAAPGVLANDTDPDSPTLTAILVNGPSHGIVTLNSNGSFTYTPAANFNGIDTFTYQANDGTANSNIATVTITVNPVNDPPVAVNDSYSTPEDTPLTVAAPGVLANDTDPDGNPLTAALVSGPSHGTVTLNSNGSFTYTPAPNYSGPDSFTYRANDGQADSNIAMVSITVVPRNHAPVAINDSYSTPEDTPLTVAAPGVLANDTDADGNPLTAILVSGPSHGTVTLNSNGSFTYTPAPNYNGPDSFTYQANDGTANSNVATVNITVNPVNDAPVAVNDSYTTNEDTPLTVAAPGVLANDTDADGNPLMAMLVSGPSHGTVTLNSNGSFTYTPAANYNGPDSFTYKANDGTANSNVATVNITVLLVNDPPVAVNDAYSTNQNTTLTVAAPGVQANDSDIDSPTVNSVLVTGPGHGTVTLNSNGSFTYTPAHNYTGPDSFTYRNNDGSADSNVATVSITVIPLQADLSLTMTVDKPAPYVGGNVVYTITVSNAGPTGTSNVAVSDTLPAGVTFVSATASQGTYNAGTGVWTIGTMAHGGSATLQITATVTTTGAKTNTAEVSASDAPDPDSTPNNHNPSEDDQASVTVAPQLAAARVTHTNTTCSDFVNGTGTDLTQAQYGVRGSTIGNVAPGVFFYYVEVQAPASNFTILIDQSENHSSFSTLFGVQQIQLYDATCTLSGLGTSSVSNGDVTINVTGATTGQVFIARVKYDTNTVVGQAAPNPTTVNYNFATRVNGTFVSQDGMALVKKAQALTAGTGAALSSTGGYSSPLVVDSTTSLLVGDWTVFVGMTDPEPQARVRDAIAALNYSLTPFGVTLLEVPDAAFADIRLHMTATSFEAGLSDGLLGYSRAEGDITLVGSWDWYFGADPAAIGPWQYDFETVVTHEMLHALGFDHSDDPASVMYEELAPGMARRLAVGSPLELFGQQESVAPLKAAADEGGSVHALPLSGLSVLAGSLLSQEDLSAFGPRPEKWQDASLFSNRPVESWRSVSQTELARMGFTNWLAALRSDEGEVPNPESWDLGLGFGLEGTGRSLTDYPFAGEEKFLS